MKGENRVFDLHSATVVSDSYVATIGTDTYFNLRRT